MDITPYVESLRRDLVAASEAGGEEVRQAAERLAMALDPSARLALMEAISQATAEITSEMPAGGVDVRLSGRELQFVVARRRTPPADASASPGSSGGEEADEGGLSRITLRIPESVKTKAEEKANQAGQCLNTWLVNVVRRATNDHAIDIDIDLSSLPFVRPRPLRPEGPPRPAPDDRLGLTHRVPSGPALRAGPADLLTPIQEDIMTDYRFDTPRPVRLYFELGRGSVHCAALDTAVSAVAGHRPRRRPGQRRSTRATRSRSSRPASAPASSGGEAEVDVVVSLPTGSRRHRSSPARPTWC